jgi:hypothetical protein
MLCPLCAKENKEGSRFCGNCGGSLNQGSASDLLDDVLGLSGGNSSAPADLNEVGLDDLFQNLSARQAAPPAQPAPPAPAPKPFPESAASPPRQAAPRPSAKPPSSGRLTMEDIIASVPDTAVNPPTTAEEARNRAAAAEVAPPPPPPPAPAEETPAPEPETRRGRQREGRQVVVKTAGAPPPLTPLTFGVAPSGWRRALAILSALAMLALLGEVGRHLVLSNLVATSVAGAGAFVMLVLTLVGGFDSRHVAKTALLGIVSLTLWSFANAASSAPVVKHVFLEFEAPLVVNGVLVLVFLLAGLTLLSSPCLPRGGRWAMGLIALLSTATLIEALALRRPFAEVLSGSGLASRLPGSLAYLEPCWVGLNAVLTVAILVAFFDLMRGLRERQWAVVVSTVLSLAIFYRVGQFGIPAFEAAGRPGLRAAVGQADALLRQQAASRGLELPLIVPEPAARPAKPPPDAAAGAPADVAPATVPGSGPAPVPAASTPSSPSGP